MGGKVPGMAVTWAGRTPGSLGSRRAGGERQAAPQRTCRDSWKALGRAGGIWPSRESALILWELVLQTDQGDGHQGPARVWPPRGPSLCQWLHRKAGEKDTEGPGKIATATPAPPPARPPASPDQLEELVLRPGVDLEGQALQHAPHPPQVAWHIGQPHRQPGGRGRERSAQLSQSIAAGPCT